MFVELEGARHHYVVRGTGPAVVFLHGLGGSLHVWHAVFERLSQAGHTLVGVDLRGHGRSGPGEARELSVEQWARDLEALIDHLDLGPVTLVGHSLGTLVAQHLAVSRPALVSRLVLVGALAGPAGDAVHERAEVVEQAGLDDLVDDWLRRALTPATHRELPQLVGLAKDLFLRNDPRSYANAMRALAQAPDVAHGRIEQPTLVLVGDQDTGTTPERTRQLADAIPGAQHRVIDGGAHWVMLERPDQVAQAIGDHLAPPSVTG